MKLKYCDNQKTLKKNTTIYIEIQLSVFDVVTKQKILLETYEIIKQENLIGFHNTVAV